MSKTQCNKCAVLNIKLKHVNNPEGSEHVEADGMWTHLKDFFF